MTVSPINDKPHVLYLDGLLNSTHYFTNFTEGGDGVSLSRQLRIEDKDVGRKALTSATIIILHCKLLYTYNTHNICDLIAMAAIILFTVMYAVAQLYI